MCFAGDNSMTSLRHCLLAILTPGGRLSQLSCAVLIIGLVAIHAAILAHLNAHVADYPPYNALSIALVVLLWMKFSALSRRFHDCDSAAFFLLPYFVLMVVSYLVAFDHGKLADSPFEEDRDLAATVESIRVAFQVSGMGIVLMALKSAGDSGPNAYGPPFSSLSGGKIAKSQIITEATRTPARGPHIAKPAPAEKPARPMGLPLAVGPRGKISPAAGSRDRKADFGRR